MKQPLYKCVITDDEPIARGVVKSYLEHLPQFAVSAEFGDAFQLLSYLKEQAVDLLFLDIKMPGLSGLDFLRSISHPPKVILITAFREYALEGFDLEVVDYLLKPVDQPRFLQALHRFEQQYNQRATVSEPAKAAHIFIKADRKTYKLLLNQIKYLESRGDYVNFYCEDQELSAKMKLSDLADQLPAHFVQTHRSFIVNSLCVRSFSTEEAELDQARIPIGRSYREHALKVLNS